jgi:hypothetical protein
MNLDVVNRNRARKLTARSKMNSTQNKSLGTARNLPTQEEHRWVQWQ